MKRLIALVVLAGCPLQKPTPAPLSACAAVDGDPVDIIEARLVGDSLEVDVAYGGGCEAHEFVLCWPDQTFAESSPVQVGLELYHNANGDMCEAYFEETITLDLIPLQESYEQGYGGNGGEILVHFAMETFEYVF